MTIKMFYSQLNKYKANITYQEYKTLQGQARAGHIEAAMKGLRKLVERNVMRRN